MRVLVWNLGWGLLGLLALTLASCAAETAASGEADGEFDSFFANGAADAWGVAEGSAEALGVLRVTNELSQRELDRLIDRRAAEGIIAVRAGADGVIGNTDDVKVSTLEALDAVPWVGPVAFGQLLREAHLRGWVNADGGVVIDPTGDGGLGTINITVPDAPNGFSWTEVSELGSVALFNEDHTSTANIAASVVGEKSWSLTAVPGTYCVGIRPQGASGYSYRCGVNVRAGDATTVRASLVWIAEVDVMDVNVGTALDEFIASQRCSGAGCEGRLTFQRSRRLSWNNRYQPVFSGDYTIEYSVPDIAALSKSVSSGQTQHDSFLPETDYRAFLYPSADPIVAATPNDCADSRRGGSLSLVKVLNNRLQWQKPISFGTTPSGRIADPVFYFPQYPGDVRVQYGYGTNGVPFEPVEIEPGKSEFIRVRRATINNVKVTVSTPNGPVEEEVQGRVSLVYGNTFGAFENTYVCARNRSLPTPMGVDLLPGLYNANVTYNTSAGSGSKDYAIDVR